VFWVNPIVQQVVEHPPAENRGWQHTDCVGNGEGDQHLDVLGEHIVDGAAHSSDGLPLINNEPSCNNAVGNEDDEKVDNYIDNHAIAGMVTVGDITAIDGVAPLEDTGEVKSIKRNDSKAPNPDEENDKIYSSISKHHIFVLTMVRRIPCYTTLIAHFMHAHTKGYGTYKIKIKTLRPEHDLYPTHGGKVCLSRPVPDQGYCIAQPMAVWSTKQEERMAI
jgi:hypothetical protein